MRVLSICAAAAALVALAGAAQAGSQGYPGDMYMPGSAGFVAGAGNAQPLVQAYPGPSMCAGKQQPVILGGQIWCGTPTGGLYAEPAQSARRSTMGTQGAPLPRAYVPAGQ
ncbi:MULTISPECIES: hypothetical protein [unclassified Salipiger]|uniref:hypothetical protein n=1 Tax=unclassified Salipiger TaxID=2640570 RepID=UPI0013BD6EFF|nr:MULTISPECIES: hypothetical protein [unclassified Salipiger]NDV52044.1 hypothetical protein [Salipiger sp. PrR003]NDW33696.1 hypothetical protein [Salipiger sp. PrR007]